MEDIPYLDEDLAIGKLFKLPLELINHTLSFLPAQELSRLFELDKLVNEDNNHTSYNLIRNIGLYQYFNHKEIIITNNSSSVFYDNVKSLLLNINQLNYLIKHKIFISPRIISFILFNENVPSKPYSEDNLLLIDLNYFKLINSNFNIQMIFVKKFNIFNQILLDNFFNNYFNLFQQRLNWFSIKDHVDVHFDNLYSFNDLINIENLQLHMFNSQKLINHLSIPLPSTDNSISPNFCVLCSNLKSLDLSYNTLNDLSQINFPPSLNYLNLSNNNLINLNNSNFNWKNLTNLKHLNLTNNTLVNLNLFDSTNETNIPTYALEKIDLSGNNLINLKFLSPSEYCSLFQNLKTIDLSRNLITNLIKFPTSLTNIKLTGNYLTSLNYNFNPLEIFPETIHTLDLSYCKLNNINDLEFNLQRRLSHLRNLNVEGNIIQYNKM
ncbi:hypothetical protein DFJ63DRAFT_216506 [Scheffersomyces coipomensis]|uniref:uncharacterized protein n=1 Tax=Scheffersomyces coipomensis TaxID=1788519 RepID=UPI00315CF3E6